MLEHEHVGESSEQFSNLQLSETQPATDVSVRPSVNRHFLRYLGMLAVVLTFLVIWFAMPTLTQLAGLHSQVQLLPSDPSLPISIAREDDTLRISAKQGLVFFGNRFSSPWINASQLLVRWVPSSDPTRTLKLQPQTYLVNINNGAIVQSPLSDRDWQAVPREDGKRLVLIQGNYDSAPQVELSNLETGEVQTVYDMNASATQWAGADAHKWDAAGMYGMAVDVNWIGDNTFVLSIQELQNDDLPGWGTRPKLMLVHTADHRVQVLAPTGELIAHAPGGNLVWQSGWVQGDLFTLAPPYNGSPVQVSTGTLWKSDVAVANNGQIAWIESEAPPGDWSRELPITCGNCAGRDRPPDPMPLIKSLAVWDGISGQVRHLSAPSDLLWEFSSTNSKSGRYAGLRWRKDDSALLYAAHIAQSSSATPGSSAKHTGLYQLDLDGRITLLQEHNWYGNLDLLWEGNDNSIYYYLTSRISEVTGYEDGPGNIWRLYSDGSVETLERGFPNNKGRAETLNGNGVIVRDLNTGEARTAVFSSRKPDEFDRGWGGVDTLVPLSPDGQWAAFEGSHSDHLSGKEQHEEILVAPIR